MPTALNQSPGYEGAPFVIGDHSRSPFESSPTRARKSNEQPPSGSQPEKMEVDNQQPTWAQQLKNFDNNSASKNSEKPVAQPTRPVKRASGPLRLEGKSVKNSWDIIKALSKDLVTAVAERFIPLLIKYWDINNATRRISMNEVRRIFQEGMRNAELTEAFQLLDPDWTAPHGCVDARNMAKGFR